MSEPLAMIEEALHRALRAGYREAKRRLLRPDLAATDGHFFPIDGSRHVGDPQHLIDAAVLDAVENALRQDMPLVRVVGEESLRSLIASEYPIAILDPVDGTKPATHLGHAWAVVLIILQVSPGRERLWIPAAGMLTSSGALLSVFEEQGPVYVQLVDDDAPVVAVADCAVGSNAQLSLACVGAKAADWEGLWRLRTSFPEATIFNVGGNPIAAGVLLGDLDAIVSFKPQSSWDALYALMVILANGVVGSIESNTTFDKTEVLGWFRTPPHGTEHEMKVVPPIIAAKDHSTYLAIVEGLRARSAGGLNDGDLTTRRTRLNRHVHHRSATACQNLFGGHFDG